MRADACWVAAGVGALALVVAHAVQAAGHVPCALCYVERWPYRLLVVAGAAGALVPRLRAGALPLLFAGLVAAVGLGLLHAGVEWGWWKSPLPECAAPVLQTANTADLLASMPALPSKPCDSPTYLIPGVRVSMALLGALYAATAVPVLAVLTRRRSVA